MICVHLNVPKTKKLLYRKRPLKITGDTVKGPDYTVLVKYLQLIIRILFSAKQVLYSFDFFLTFLVTLYESVISKYKISREGVYGTTTVYL